MSATKERASTVRRDALLAWYGEHRRELPWRRSSDAYAVWISESMLQQTRVEAVIPYFERFLERFPTVEALAGADLDEVLARWSGLGYYSRARRLHAAARLIMDRHAGEFPRTSAEAEALPGVGAYTAGAVLSIAYGLSEPLVDGNVRRVLARWFAIEGDVTKAAQRREIEGLAASLVEGVGDPGAWNQALMELGATVCLPREPRCDTCPVARECAAREKGLESILPKLPQRPTPIDVEIEVFLVEERGRVLLQRRDEGGRMAGLWELPTREMAVGEPLLFSSELDLTLLPREEIGVLRHSITKHRILARVIGAVPGSDELPEDWAWFHPSEIDGLGVTGMTKKALSLVRDRPR